MDWHYDDISRDGRIRGYALFDVDEETLELTHRKTVYRDWISGRRISKLRAVTVDAGFVKSFREVAEMRVGRDARHQHASRGDGD